MRLRIKINQANLQVQLLTTRQWPHFKVDLSTENIIKKNVIKF